MCLRFSFASTIRKRPPFYSYILAGMPVFDAACHAMSVSATGGFSTRNASIAAFDSRWIEGLTMLFMYLSSLHFGVIYPTMISFCLVVAINISPSEQLIA